MCACPHTGTIVPCTWAAATGQPNPTHRGAEPWGREGHSKLWAVGISMSLLPKNANQGCCLCPWFHPRALTSPQRLLGPIACESTSPLVQGNQVPVHGSLRLRVGLRSCTCRLRGPAPEGPNYTSFGGFVLPNFSGPLRPHHPRIFLHTFVLHSLLHNSV